MKWLILLLLLLPISTRAEEITLCLTVPSHNTTVLYPNTDSSMIVCGTGEPTADVEWIKFWKIPINGGTWRVIDSLYVRGLEGQQVCKNIEAGIGGHFYAQGVDTLKNAACAGNVIYWGPVTSVPIDKKKFGYLKERVYTADGRLIQTDRPIAAGVYFWGGYDSKGNLIRRGKLVILK